MLPLTNGSHDKDAGFSEYVATHAEQVRFTAYLLCGDWHEAEDLAQTAFVRLYLAWERVDRTEPINAYVRKIVTRTYLNERRRLWRKLERLTSAPPEPTAESPPAPEQRMLIMRALSQLPRRQRAALVLRYWEDLSLIEAAEVLGCSVGTPKGR
ncbi:RNA polymerase sigma-70 factor (sigma-E family) [Micromonospora sp. Llam0]|nr:RNA polymerase sigma-70 factor (sigma-E family) [Micromonospora sp. Llam0]